MPAQGYLRPLVAQVASDGAQHVAAQAASHVAHSIAAQALASAPAGLAGAPLYAGALNAVAGGAAGAAGAAVGNFVRRSLGGGGPPDADASAAYLPGGLVVAEVRRIFERQVPVPLEQQFVERGAPRDGAAVRAMQAVHDLAGGSAPHLDFKSLNGMNEGYAPADRRMQPGAKLGPVEALKAHAPMPFAGQPIKRKGQDVVMAAASSNDRPPPPPPPGAAKIARRNASAPELFLAGTPYAEALAMQQHAPVALDAAALAPYAGPRRERERSPLRGD